MSQISEERAKAYGLIETAHREDREAVELLTVKEYAARYGVHVQTVYAAIRDERHLAGAAVRPTSRTIRIAVPKAA